MSCNGDIDNTLMPNRLEFSHIFPVHEWFIEERPTTDAGTCNIFDKSNKPQNAAGIFRDFFKSRLVVYRNFV